MGDAEKKMKDFTSGYLAGLAGMPLAVVPIHDSGNTGEIVAYLYNGVELPPLPEWDKSTYPYFCIATHKTTNETAFICKEFKFTMSVEDSIVMVTTNDYNSKLEDGQWVQANLPGFNWVPIWCRQNIYYSDSIGGGLYLAESDPVPVYAEADIDNKAIMLGCRLGYIIRSQMGSDQVKEPDEPSSSSGM